MAKQPKEIITETVSGIIDRYAMMVVEKNEDQKFIDGFNNPEKKKEECINYVMNNLVNQQIYGGDDSLMYQYIHDYYVDDLDVSLTFDNWSNRLGGVGGSSKKAAPENTKPTKEQIVEAYESLTNEEKNEIYLKQKERVEKELYEKALAEEKERERKAKEKEKARLEEEKAKKENEKKNGAFEQTSIFDFLGE